MHGLLFCLVGAEVEVFLLMQEQDEDEYEDDVEEDEEDAVSATIISLCFSVLLVKVWRFCTGLTEKFVSAFNISRVLC